MFAVTILINPCLYFNVKWLPTNFSQQRGLQPGRELGWILTLIYQGPDLGYLFSGAAVLGLTKRGRALSARASLYSLRSVDIEGSGIPMPTKVGGSETG